MNIKLEHIDYQYDEEEIVLQDFNLEISDGEFIALIGHNGSGKSTIAKIIMGLLEPLKGNLIIDGVKIDSLSNNEEAFDKFRENMGIIFQNPDNQFVGVTVRDDIAFGLENRQVPREEMIKRIDESLEKVSMTEFDHANPEALSGGQKQRVAIAGALAMDTNLLIFDESTSMLDPKGTKEVNEMIRMIRKQENKTIIVITHNLEEVKFADRVIVLNKGKIVLDSTPKEVFKHSDILVDAGLKTLDSLEILNELNTKKYKNKKDIEEALWELSFQE